MDLKRLFKAYERAEAAANKAYDLYDAEPENDAAEKAFDDAYKAEFKAFESLADGIAEITGGMIDKKTARTMIRVKRAELKALINRMA